MDKDIIMAVGGALELYNLVSQVILTTPFQYSDKKSEHFERHIESRIVQMMRHYERHT